MHGSSRMFDKIFLIVFHTHMRVARAYLGSYTTKSRSNGYCARRFSKKNSLLSYKM
jgi:hypothetical protein